MFITIDGGDGCGKSTQIGILAKHLTSLGREVVVCRDPGSTDLGVAIRSLLLNQGELNPCPESELFLFMAARAQMVDRIIAPALAEGSIVLADRFLLSSLVYQGFAGGIAPETILQMGKIAARGILPDLTIVLDISTSAAFARLRRPLDRIESKGREFHEKIRSGFIQGANFWIQQTGRDTFVLDSSLPLKDVSKKIAAEVLRRLRRLSPNINRSI